MLLPPLSLTMAEGSRCEGISDMSLSNWRKKVSSQGNVVPEDKPLSENWSAEARFAVVLETASLSQLELGEYCRRKGLYPEQVNAWRQACITGQQTVQVQQKVDREQARKDKKRIQELERELRRKDKALAETAALLVLRKKLNDYWGIDSEDN
jgi:transposase-like protein